MSQDIRRQCAFQAPVPRLSAGPEQAPYLYPFAGRGWQAIVEAMAIVGIRAGFQTGFRDSICEFQQRSFRQMGLWR